MRITENKLRMLVRQAIKEGARRSKPWSSPISDFITFSNGVAASLMSSDLGRRWWTPDEAPDPSEVRDFVQEFKKTPEFAAVTNKYPLGKREEELEKSVSKLVKPSEISTLPYEVMYSEKSVNEIFPGLFDFSFVREKGAFNAELTRIKNAGGPKNTAPEPSRAEMRRLDEPDWEMMGSGTPEEIGRRYGKMGRGGSGYDR